MNEYDDESIGQYVSNGNGAAVRTKGFEIDGSNDPKRGFKRYSPARIGRRQARTNEVISMTWNGIDPSFQGATAADMPR